MTIDTEQASVIEPGVMYALAEAKTRMGWGAHAFRTARRKGLKVLYQGRRGFVMGDELIRHVREHGDPHEQGTSETED